MRTGEAEGGVNNQMQPEMARDAHIQDHEIATTTEPVVEQMFASSAVEQVPLVQEDPAAKASIDPNAWQVIPVLPRLDAVNHADLMSEVHAILADGTRRVALDLTQNRFFSLGAIQLCVSLARDLAADDGAFALIGCPERTKRHFEIYGSLKQIRVVRSAGELVQGRNEAVITRRRVSTQEAR